MQAAVQQLGQQRGGRRGDAGTALQQAVEAHRHHRADLVARQARPDGVGAATQGAQGEGGHVLAAEGMGDLRAEPAGQAVDRLVARDDRLHHPAAGCQARLGLGGDRHRAATARDRGELGGAERLAVEREGR
jgi:hypothetical protein